ncbi:hypothetical protein J6590_019050 [Homalodisca vitripennis]|nr:hypothetical protein J6590_019050 [Homalodisca vitripennis]
MKQSIGTTAVIEQTLPPLLVEAHMKQAQQLHVCAGPKISDNIENAARLPTKIFKAISSVAPIWRVYINTDNNRHTVTGRRGKEVRDRERESQRVSALRAGETRVCTPVPVRVTVQCEDRGSATAPGAADHVIPGRQDKWQVLVLAP